LKRIKESAPLVDNSSGAGASEPEIDCLIMVDREIDLVSPFCVNQTYEGLLDEFFGIKTCSITVDTTIVKPDANKDAKAPVAPTITLGLTNEDEIFKEVRDKHFNTLERTFSQKCREIQNIFKEKDAPQSIDELEKYITKLRTMNIAKGKDVLTYHINLAYHINQ
jgi:hypothetical protein